MCNGRESADNSVVVCREFAQTFADPSLMLVKTLLHDCHRMLKPLYTRADYERDLQTIARRTRCNGLVFLAKTLPSLFSELLLYLETGHASYPDFKLKPGKNYPVLFSGLFRHIYSTTCDQCTKAKIIGLLYQMTNTFKKLKGPYTNDVLGEQLAEFCEVDNSLYTSSEEEDATMTIILNKARALINRIFKDFSIDDSRLIPRPGPGATNHPTIKAVRYHPHVLYDQLEDLMPSNIWHSPTTCVPRNYEHMCVGVKVSPQMDPIDDETSQEAAPTSRFKFVNKEFGKPRGICIEELEMQWRQQAFRSYLYDHVERHPLTKGYVNFTDQTINGKLALANSKMNLESATRLATGDMSSASDRISRKLVERLFDGTELYKYLDALSTRVIKLPHIPGYDLPDELQCKKFAPMGSAICFPVMALVHYVLIKAIISTFHEPHIYDARVWVYGDDLIYPCIYADTIYRWLPKFGMKLNTGKSFYRSLFRESCGKHAYNGVDITPIRIKSILINPPVMRDLAASLRYEASLYLKGYNKTAELLRTYIRKALTGVYLPYVHSESPVIGFKRPLGDALVDETFKLFCSKRWCKETQQWLYKARVLAARSSDESPPVSVRDLYLRKQVESPLVVDRLDEVPAGDIISRWSWVPSSAFIGGLKVQGLLYDNKPYTPLPKRK